ncbi:NB-ARC domain-containing protein [Oceanicoccus sp. KOV_DT_Chl]|uniref:NB-ARC domain-containing protein n=1 Tax=Oceanicoccus sp. KOV_DT_Chl TaxID=1904639 RepID=UPI000C7B36BF|nr:NB-ARC domain-containing protein [Oceanicoccus sp. KOV_DT_Chl]
MNKRADFSEKTRNLLAHRAGGMCANPYCRRETLGGHSDPGKATITGEAAHIFAARPGGPRPNLDLGSEDLKSPTNGLWLCSTCHTAVDRDDSTYLADVLFKWKYDAETSSQERLIKAASTLPSQDPSVLQMWCHETTDDDDYIPRTNQLDALNKWVADKNTKVIAVTGIGGQGKTSLIGHWIKNGYPLNSRNFDVVFYWSFYNDDSVSVFFNAFISFVEQAVNSDNVRYDRDQPLKSLRKIIKETNVLLVMDGLEMLQNSPNHPSYGQFVESDLRHFLCDICSSPSQTMAVLTSRFDVVDLRQYVPRVKNMPLDNLTEEEGSQLLGRFFVGGSDQDRFKISQSLRGHPLALRIFAAGLPEEMQANPLPHLDSVLAGVADDPANDLEEKLARLLLRYESTLNHKQRELLTGVSLLSRPIDERSLMDLVQKTYIKNAYESDVNIDDVDIQQLDDISRLVSSGLVYRDYFKGVYSYSCHPIIRDYFRAQFSGDAEKSYDVGSFLANRPGRNIISKREDVEWYVSAVEIFAAGNNWYEADDLYENKLNSGLVFLKYATPFLGKRAAEALSDSSKISNSSVSFMLFGEKYKDRNLISAFYKSSAGRFCLHLGDYRRAREYFEEAGAVYLKRKKLLNQAKALDGLAHCSVLEGDLNGALTYAQDALKIATNENFTTEDFRPFLLTMGEVAFLSGDIERAVTMLNSVISSFSKNTKNNDHLAEAYIKKAEVVRSLDELDLSAELAEKGLDIAGRASRNDYIIYATWLVGAINYDLGKFDKALELINSAENMCRKAALEPLLIRILTTQALLMAEIGDINKAGMLIEDCINVSSTRQFNIYLVDALLAKVIINIRRDDVPNNTVAHELADADSLSLRCKYRLVDAEISAYKNII